MSHNRSPLLEPLPLHEDAAVASLRRTMDGAGSAFDFVVLRVPPSSVAIGVEHHRDALQALFEAVEARNLQRRHEFFALHPAHADGPCEALQFHTAQAVATPLGAQAVLPAAYFRPGYRVGVSRAAGDVSWFEWLAQAFDNPPYALRVDDPEVHARLFPKFCACTGLMPGENIEVLDWVGDPEREPGRSTWSNYFDDGKEWWGIWCLTVWNPRHRTLAAIAASQTD